MGVACQVGAVVVGDMGQDTAARRFGEALRVAFQLQAETLGKSPSDLEERKRGLPVVLAVPTRARGGRGGVVGPSGGPGALDGG